MKKFIYFLYFLPTTLYSQEFKVDCGNDTAFCKSSYQDTIYLGTQVKLFNGVPPYIYKWSCRYVIDNTIIITAKDFLNDTTLLNPYFKSFPIDGDRLVFNLTVEDSSGKKTSDSITIRFSQFAYALGYFGFEMNIGDSIQFGDLLIGGAIKPLKFYWTPSTGLSDSAVNFPWCKPFKSTDYYQMAIDSAGCKSALTIVYMITVIHTQVKSINNYNGLRLNSHQAGSKIVFDNTLNLPAIFIFYSIDGKKVFESRINCSFIDIAQLDLSSGIYLYVLKMKNNTETGKFINSKIQ